MISLSGDILHKKYRKRKMQKKKENEFYQKDNMDIFNGTPYPRKKERKEKAGKHHFGVSAKYQNRSRWKKKTSEISRGLWQQFRNMWEFNCRFLCANPLASRFLSSSVLKICILSILLRFSLSLTITVTQATMYLWLCLCDSNTKWMLDEGREDKNRTTNG